jgi:hypothetical protein
MSHAGDRACFATAGVATFDRQLDRKPVREWLIEPAIRLNSAEGRHAAYLALIFPERSQIMVPIWPCSGVAVFGYEVLN